MTATSGRLLKLLSLLQARRDWPGAELAGRLGVSGRTIRRDVERLRALGYPVDALTGPAGGYRLHAGTAMPPLLLDDDEAVAIAVGLRTAAGASVTGIEETSIRALVKLEQVLPAHLRRRVSAIGAATSTLVPAGGPTVDPGTLTTIAGACRDRERLRFGYRRRDGTQSRRTVEPLSLANLGRHWYLVAWDCDRDAWRTFRVDRLEGPAPAGGRFTPRELPHDDPAVFVAAHLSGAPYRYQARVTLHAPASAIAERVPHPWGSLEPLDERTCEYRTSDDSLDWLAVRIGMLGVDFEVHEPPELVERFGVLARRFAAASADVSSAATRGIARP
jgi:predicted DNA-binding transcriptional regulator YafY